MNSNVLKTAAAVEDLYADLQAVRLDAHRGVERAFEDAIGRIVPLQAKLQEKKRRLSRERVAKAA